MPNRLEPSTRGAFGRLPPPLLHLNHGRTSDGSLSAVKYTDPRFKCSAIAVKSRTSIENNRLRIREIIVQRDR